MGVSLELLPTMPPLHTHTHTHTHIHTNCWYCSILSVFASFQIRCTNMDVMNTENGQKALSVSLQVSNKHKWVKAYVNVSHECTIVKWCIHSSSAPDYMSNQRNSAALGHVRQFVCFCFSPWWTLAIALIVKDSVYRCSEESRVTTARWCSMCHVPFCPTTGWWGVNMM